MKSDTGKYAPVKRVSETHTNLTAQSQDGRHGSWVRWRTNKQAAAARAFKAKG